MCAASLPSVRCSSAQATITCINWKSSPPMVNLSYLRSLHSLAPFSVTWSSSPELFLWKVSCVFPFHTKPFLSLSTKSVSLSPISLYHVHSHQSRTSRLYTGTCRKFSLNARLAFCCPTMPTTWPSTSCPVPHPTAASLPYTSWGKETHGDIYSRGLSTGFYPSILLFSSSKILLPEEEGWFPQALHRLSGSQSDHRKGPQPTPP